LNFIYPFKFYSNFTNKNVSWLHFSWPTRYSVIITANIAARGYFLLSVLPRDAMRKRGLCCRPVSVRLSVRHVGGLYPDS